MAWSDIAENWTAYIPQILATWPELDEEDLAELEGDRNGLLELLTDLYDGDDEMAQSELDEWEEGAETSDVLIDTHPGQGFGDTELEEED